jgi:hypothetical protein
MHLSTAILLGGALGAAALPSAAEDATNVFARYAGNWTLVIRGADAPAERRITHTFENSCAAAGQFYICEQRTGDSPPIALVFSPTPDPHVFHSTVLASDGAFQQAGTVQVHGARWEYPWEERDSAGQRHFFRVINTWVDDRHILYRKEESLDGRQWRMLESGEEERVANQVSKTAALPTTVQATNITKPS